MNPTTDNKSKQFRNTDARRVTFLTRVSEPTMRACIPPDQPRSEYEHTDLLAWSQRYLPTHFIHPPSAMHHWLAEELDAMRSTRGRRVNVIGPRGSAKSTVATLAHVLRAAVERREKYIWIVSDTKQQAQTHLENIKTELVENELLAKAYPQAVGIGPRWRSTAIQLRNGVTIESYGTGQRIRGRRRGANRPTLIVCDDLQNDGHMASAELRASSRNWFHGTLLNAGTPNTNIVNLATALHREALALELHATAGWRSELFRAIDSWPQRLDLWELWEETYTNLQDADAPKHAREFYDQHREAMDSGAQVLWPEVEDLYTLMRLRVETGRTAFNREKQGSPIDPAACEWPEDYFADDIWFNEWPDVLPLRTIALDPSKGRDARHGDYSALIMLGVDRTGTCYVEADLARRPTPQIVADGVDWCRRFRPMSFGVEANQWQDLLAAEFIAEFRRQGILGVVPCEIHNYTAKQTRIRRLGPYLSQRRLRFKRNSASTKLLVDQLRDFPMGSHDDGPDALEMALRLAEELTLGQMPSDGLGSRLPVG